METTDSRIDRFFRRLMGERRGTGRAEHPFGRRQSDREPVRGWIPALWIGATVAALDWAAKFAVSSSMALGDFRVVIDGRVALWHVRNPAMILGLWGNLPLGARKGIAVFAAVVGVLFLLQIVGRAHRLPRRHRGWAWVFVGLVFGGMLGNLGERAVHWGVTDYLSIRWGEYWLPPGNIADIALFLSFPLAVLVIAFEVRGRARRGARSDRRFRALDSTPDAVSAD